MARFRRMQAADDHRRTRPPTTPKNTPALRLPLDELNTTPSRIPATTTPSPTGSQQPDQISTAIFTQGPEV